MCEQHISVAENTHTDRMNSQGSSAYRHQYLIEAVGPYALRERNMIKSIQKNLCSIENLESLAVDC